MDYGDIFVGTFRTIWRHKLLWLFGMLGRLIMTLGGIGAGLLSLRLLPAWISFIERFSSGAVPTPGELPADLIQQLSTLWAGLLCVGFLGFLVNYVVNLIMRGATIGEAAVAWGGQITDSGRGLRTGTGRALHLFVLDLLWWVPIALIVLIVVVGGFVSLVGLAAAAGGNNQGAANASILLFCCGLPCCLLLFGVAVAVIYGTFSPLMYQAAVQSGRPGGQRTLGQAFSEGWRLARTHWGAMFILWLLLAVLTIAGWALLAAISYPFNAAASGGLADWFTALFENAQSGLPTATPPMPAVNTGLLVLASAVEAVLGLLVYGFLQTFGLTMYAEVYRRLTGEQPEPSHGPSGGYPAPSAPITSSEFPPAPEGGAGEGGARVYDRPEDLGLSVPEEQPEDDKSRPAL